MDSSGDLIVLVDPVNKQILMMRKDGLSYHIKDI